MSEWRWNIRAARVTTWGGNACGAFYVTNRAGEPLDVTDADTHLRTAFAEPSTP